MARAISIVTPSLPVRMTDAERWLVAFHDGEAQALERCYVQHFDDVRAAVGRILGGADRDTVVHSVFLRLVSDAKLRGSFKGGTFGAWITVVARNEAIDFQRKYGREVALATADLAQQAAVPEEAMHAKLLVERFQLEKLPEKLRPVFEARFLRQLSQREAARELAMQRTTLVYQEQQIRDALRAFLLEEP